MQKSPGKKSARSGRQIKSNAVAIKKLTLHKLDWLEWITIGLAVWFFFYPHPYKILLGILLVIPVVGLLLNGLHKPSLATLVEISVDKHGQDKYDVADFIDVAAWAILIRLLLDYKFESFYSMIIPGTIACVIILIILFLTHKLIEQSARNKWWIYSSLIFNVGLYSYAGTYAANCAYDYSVPQVYRTEVLGKHVSKSRKSTTYYVKVAPWGHHYDKENISVSGSQYEEISVGELIDIDLKEGLFGIQWYYIEKKHNTE